MPIDTPTLRSIVLALHLPFLPPTDDRLRKAANYLADRGVTVRRTKNAANAVGASDTAVTATLIAMLNERIQFRLAMDELSRRLSKIDLNAVNI